MCVLASVLVYLNGCLIAWPFAFLYNCLGQSAVTLFAWLCVCFSVLRGCCKQNSIPRAIDDDDGSVGVVCRRRRLGPPQTYERQATTFCFSEILKKIRIVK